MSRHWHALFLALILLAGAGSLLHSQEPAPADPTPPSPPPPPPLVSLSVHPAIGNAFTFGLVTDTVFTVKNISERALVVRSIAPLTNQSEDDIELANSVYGDIEKQEGEDAYRFYPNRQGMTSMTLYAGLLLPDQEVSVAVGYRPLAKRESFRIEILAADAPYDSMPASLAPLVIYNTGKDRDERFIFRPFWEKNWKAVSAEKLPVAPPGPDAPSRCVLLSPSERKRDMPEPAPAGTPVQATLEVPFAFDGEGFFLDAARAAAAKLSGAKPDTLDLAYSKLLGGYVVDELPEGLPTGDPLKWGNCWLLKSADQAAKEPALPSLPAVLLKEMDRLPQAGSPVRVRVGDKQEGDPQAGGRLAGYQFWESHPVWFGDGMYTRGEYIQLEGEGFLAFLARVKEKGGRLVSHAYYFRSRYYLLELPKAEEPKPEPPKADPPKAEEPKPAEAAQPVTGG